MAIRKSFIDGWCKVGIGLITCSYWDKTSSGYYVSETLVDINCACEYYSLSDDED